MWWSPFRGGLPFDGCSPVEIKVRQRIWLLRAGFVAGLFFLYFGLCGPFESSYNPPRQDECW